MLILTRRVGEAVIIGNDVEITVLGVKGNQVRLGVKAPKDVTVHREEIYDRIAHEKAHGQSNGQSNGHGNGHTNGHSNGHTNGHGNGYANGHGTANGAIQVELNGNLRHLEN